MVKSQTPFLGGGSFYCVWFIWICFSHFPAWGYHTMDRLRRLRLMSQAGPKLEFCRCRVWHKCWRCLRRCVAVQEPGEAGWSHEGMTKTCRFSRNGSRCRFDMLSALHLQAFARYWEFGSNQLLVYLWNIHYIESLFTYIESLYLDIYIYIYMHVYLTIYWSWKDAGFLDLVADTVATA